MKQLKLNGVDHTARPTWKLKETINFYKEILELELIHVISAKGWGPETHPDFLHFFFDSGAGSTIAFFYYMDSTVPRDMHERESKPPIPEDHVFDATHTAWCVETEEELEGWRKKLAEKGLNVSVVTRHEMIESIYVRDPNGYLVEMTRKLRDLQYTDVLDARLTIEAALSVEAEPREEGRTVGSIDQVWNRKGEIQRRRLNLADKADVVRLYVPKLAEFSALAERCRTLEDVSVTEVEDYWVVESTNLLRLSRKELGMKPALWYGMFTGGVQGHISRFDKDVVEITQPQVGRENA